MKSFNDEFSDIKHEYATGNHLAKLEKILNELKKASCIIYGAGWYGHELYKFFQNAGVNVAAFCDTFKAGTDSLTGLKLISPDELVRDYSSAALIIGIGLRDNYDAAATHLMKIGFGKPSNTFEDFHFLYYGLGMFRHTVDIDDIMPFIERYDSVWNLLEDDTSRQVLLDRIKYFLLGSPMPHSLCENQYFEPGIIHLEKDEVFVDGGFYTGDTTITFIKKTNGQFKHVFGFELEEANTMKFEPHLLSDVTIVLKGLWSCEDILSFNSKKDSSHINEEYQGGGGGYNTIPVTSIDKYFHENVYQPTFIKLDIEGAEKQALLGMEKTIKMLKPKLAVCVYHKPEDIYELPGIIHELNKGYRLFLRHYTNISTETVLYAV